MKRDTSRLPFTRALRADGFSRLDSDKEPLIYTKTVRNRRLEVQVWRNGQHRMSHFLGGRMSTYPTEFWSVAGMRHGIVHELTRKDHPPRQRGK